MATVSGIVLAYFVDYALAGSGSWRWMLALSAIPALGVVAILARLLHARLDRLSGQRPPLDTEYRPPPSFLSEVFVMFNPLDPMAGFPQLFNRRQRPQLGPYCGIAED